MSKLTLREYTAAFIVAPLVLGLVLTFSGGVFNTFDADVDDAGIEGVQSDFEEAQPDLAEQQDEVGDVSIRTDFFFLSEIWNVITSVVRSVGQITGLFSSVINEFNMPGELMAISAVIVAGIIFEVVSLARGMRT